MKIVAKSLGAVVLNLFLATLWLFFIATLLWILVPFTFPGVALTFWNYVGMASLLFLVRGLFKS